jgi:hypothetical protein
MPGSICSFTDFYQFTDIYGFYNCKFMAVNGNVYGRKLSMALKLQHDRKNDTFNGNLLCTLNPPKLSYRSPAPTVLAISAHLPFCPITCLSSRKSQRAYGLAES